MNPGQEQFYNFILERVKTDKTEEAKALLQEEFKKQSEGTFTQDDAMQFIPKIIALLQPDKIEAVQEVMKQFAQNMKH